MPGNYAALEAARLARDPRDLTAPVALPAPPKPDPRGHWSVVRKYDDGRLEPIRMNMPEAAAAKLAGELRDKMPDAECAKGYNIVAHPSSRGFVFPNGKDRAVLRRGRAFLHSTDVDVDRPIPYRLTPEQAAKQRSEHARKAGRASWRNR